MATPLELFIGPLVFKWQQPLPLSPLWRLIPFRPHHIHPSPRACLHVDHTADKAVDATSYLLSCWSNKQASSPISLSLEHWEYLFNIFFSHLMFLLLLWLTDVWTQSCIEGSAECFKNEHAKFRRDQILLVSPINHLTASCEALRAAQTQSQTLGRLTSLSVCDLLLFSPHFLSISQPLLAAPCANSNA